MLRSARWRTPPAARPCREARSDRGPRQNASRKPWQPIDEVSRGEHISVEFARRGLDPCGRVDGVAEKHDLAMQVAHLAHDDRPDVEGRIGIGGPRVRGSTTGHPRRNRDLCSRRSHTEAAASPLAPLGGDRDGARDRTPQCGGNPDRFAPTGGRPSPVRFQFNDGLTRHGAVSWRHVKAPPISQPKNSERSFASHELPRQGRPKPTSIVRSNE